MLRTPVTRRGSPPFTSNGVPAHRARNGAKTPKAPSAASFLIDAQIAIDLPRRHVPDVVVPFLALGRHEVLEEMLAQRFTHEHILLELVERLTQVARELVDPQVAPFPVAHGEDVLVDGRPRVDLAPDP